MDERHAGDLGNIVADANGTAVVDISDAQVPEIIHLNHQWELTLLDFY